MNTGISTQRNYQLDVGFDGTSKNLSTFLKFIFSVVLQKFQIPNVLITYKTNLFLDYMIF